jgi:hypothetical protein
LSRSYRPLVSIITYRSTATTIDHSIFCDVQQCLNDPATGSIGDNHRTTVYLQVFQFERGHCDEAMSPVGRDAFLTMDNLAASACALNDPVWAVHPNNLIDAGSTVSV